MAMQQWMMHRKTRHPFTFRTHSLCRACSADSNTTARVEASGAPQPDLKGSGGPSLHNSAVTVGGTCLLLRSSATG